MTMGTDFLMQAAIKALGLDPEEIKQQINGVLHLGISIDARMKRIEEKLDAVLALHNPPPALTDDAYTANLNNGVKNV